MSFNLFHFTSLSHLIGICSHEIDSPSKKVSDGDKNDLNNDDVNDGEEKKKKKRSQKKNNIMTNEVNDDELAPMSEGYMGGKVFQNDCPLLNAIEKRCRGIDLLTGDTHHNLLEACGAHQLCYLCVSYRLYYT